MEAMWKKLVNVELPRRHQRRILIALVVLGMVEGLAISSVGILISFRLGSLLKKSLRWEGANELYGPYLHLDDVPASLPMPLLTNNLGNTLVVLGVVTGVVSAVGLAAAVIRVRSLLLLFVMLMVTLVLMQIICLMVILHKESPQSLLGRERMQQELQHRGSIKGRENVKDPWVASFYLLMVVLDCCGIDSPHDFCQLYTNKYVPEVCCSRDFMLSHVVRHTQALGPCGNIARDTGKVSHGPKTGNTENNSGNSGTVSAKGDLKCSDTVTVGNLTDCTHSSPDFQSPNHKQQGCYDAIFEKIKSSLLWLVPVLLCFLFTQMGTILAAVYVCNRREVAEQQELLDRNPL